MVTVEMQTALNMPLPIISLIDRTSNRPARKRFVFMRSLEQIVWGAREKSNGVLAQLLQRLSQDSCIYTVHRASVDNDDAWLKEQEFQTILQIFRENCVHDVEVASTIGPASGYPKSTQDLHSTLTPLPMSNVHTHNIHPQETIPRPYQISNHLQSPSILPLDSQARRRVRQCSMIPLSVCVSALTTHGRNDGTVAVLKQIKALPRLWQMEIEQEKNHDEGVHDMTLHEEIQEEADETLENYDLAHELVIEYVQWMPSEEDDARVSQIVPGRSLQKQLEQLESFRTSKLNHLRVGSYVQPITFAGEKACLLRFFGWYQRAFEDPEPTMAVLTRPDLGARVQQYAEWLKNDRELKWSSISNYLAALIQSVLFALTTTTDASAEVYDQICNLRRQAEKQAAQDQLYRRKEACWLSWDDVQRTRQTAINTYNSADATKRRGLLKTVLLIILHSCAPPDRVVCLLCALSPVNDSDSSLRTLVRTGSNSQITPKPVVAEAGWCVGCRYDKTTA